MIVLVVLAVLYVLYLLFLARFRVTQNLPGVIIPEVADLEGDTMTALEAAARKW